MPGYLYKSGLDVAKVFIKADQYDSVLENFLDRQKYSIVSLVQPVADAPILERLSIVDDIKILSAKGSNVPIFLIGKSVARLVTTAVNPDPNPDNLPVITNPMGVSFLDSVGFYDEKKKKAMKNDTTFKLPNQNHTFYRFLRDHPNVLDGGKMRGFSGHFDDPMKAYLDCDWLPCILLNMVDKINSMEDPEEKALHMQSKLLLLYLFCICNGISIEIDITYFCQILFMLNFRMRGYIPLQIWVRCFGILVR